MDRDIPATEANRDFSRLLREVQKGESFTVTSHGRPVARIVPVADAVELTAARREAAARLLDRLRAQPALNLGKMTRDEIYEDRGGSTL